MELHCTLYAIKTTHPSKMNSGTWQLKRCQKSQHRNEVMREHISFFQRNFFLSLFPMERKLDELGAQFADYMRPCVGIYIHKQFSWCTLAHDFVVHTYGKSISLQPQSIRTINRSAHIRTHRNISNRD